MSINSTGIEEKVNYKRHALLQMIRRERGIGRLELARRLGISNSRVCDLVQLMLDEGILAEDHERDDRRGRRGVPVTVNPDYGTILGFDMEAKRMRMALVNFAGDMVWNTQQSLGATRTRQAFVDTILRFIENGQKEAARRKTKILAIGLAVSGFVDVRRGVILRNRLLPYAKDVPLRDLVSDRTGLTCFMDDNIRALTLAEWQEGAAQQMDHFVCIAIRTGVGSGIVAHGKLYTGSHGFAGEVGNMPVPVGPSLAQWKTFEELVSEHALEVSSEEDYQALPDQRAKRAGELLGAHLAAIATLLDPQAIVLAGNLIRPGGPLWDNAERAFRRLILPELVDRVQLRPARLGPFAAALGATHLCFQRLYPTESTVP